MRRNVAAELAEGFEALAVNRLSQRALPPPEVESMTPPSDLMEDLVALERELHDPAVRRNRARVEGRWQVHYHQATPTIEPPEKAKRAPNDP